MGGEASLYGTQATFQLYSSSVGQYRRCILPGKASTNEDVTNSD